MNRRVALTALAVAVVVVTTAAAVVAVAAIGRKVNDPDVATVTGPPDALVVFAGEAARFLLAEELVAVGTAPVLVLSAPDLPEVAARWCDEPPGDVEVVCVGADATNTRDEARVFADLARQRGWDRIVAVTSDYHAQRAVWHLTACFDGEVGTELVHYDTLPNEVWSKEFGANLWVRTVARGC